MEQTTIDGIEYTTADFLEKDDVFRKLHEIKNPLTRSQAIERFSAGAKLLGVSNFKALFKAYQDGQKGALMPANNASDAPDQPIDLNTGEWIVDEYGVRRPSSFGEAVACQFPVYITRRFENIDSGTEKIELSWRKGGYWRKLIIPCSQYAAPRELVKLSDAGLPINLRMAQELSDFLTDIYSFNYDQIPVSRSVGRMGWIDVEDWQFSPFVPGLVYDGGSEYAAIFDATKPAGSFASWLDAARAFRRESTAARIVLAASFASVLVKPLGGLPCFVHLWGVDSSTGKTVALMASASVWASPEMGKYIKTFDGTDVGYERIAAFLNSMPLCIDELQLARNARGQVVFNVYRLSQGAGRVRGNRGGGIDVTPTWSNIMITTGETPLNTAGSGAGAVNRVIEIECTSAHKVVEDGHAIAQAFRKNYGHAGRHFVERLQQPGNIEEAQRLYQAAFTALNSSQTTDKQAMAAAMIVAADQLATRWLFGDDYALTAQDLAAFLADRAAVSTGVRGYEYMCDWVARNINRLQPGIEQGDVYGIVEDDYAYIISSVFRSAAEEGGFNAQALLSYLKSGNLIRLQNGKTTVVKRIKGALTRCVCLKTNSLPEDFDEESDLI